MHRYLALLLYTHKKISGPAQIKLSEWGWVEQDAAGEEQGIEEGREWGCVKVGKGVVEEAATLPIC